MVGLRDPQVWLTVSVSEEEEVSLVCCCLAVESGSAVCDLMHCSPPASSVDGILQVRILEWVAISFSREFS